MQFDAGPGDRTDREWKLKERKKASQARRQRFRVTLPDWAFIAIPVAALAVLGIVIALIVRAVTGGGEPSATSIPPTGEATTAPVNSPTATQPSGPTPTFTVALPEIGGTPPPPVYTEIGVGAPVQVQGTGGGLNLREQPSTAASVVATVQDGTPLHVVDGPTQADGYTWWQVQTAEGTRGWGASNWLVLRQEP